MTHILKALTVALIALLAVGPVYAAQVDLTPGLHLTAPADRHSTTVATMLTTLGLGVVAFGITIRKDTGSIAAKFVTRAGAAAGDYKDGVTNAGPSWEANTSAAEGNWEQGTTAAIASKRFAKNVTGKGSKYQTNAVNLGSQRYGPGVANAKDAYARGVQPYLDTLKGLQLPPKGPRGSQQNQARANAVAVALGAARTGK